MTAFLLAGLLCLSLCACGGEPQTTLPGPEPSASEVPRQAKGFSLAYDPGASLHPITGESQLNLELSPLLYEGLYALDEAFAPQPVLAAETQVDDSGLVWTITVAEGVCFSDGTLLEARHVASSLNAARGSAVYKSRLSGITSVRAAGDQVVITLSAPNGALPALLDVPVVLEGGGDAPLGTGRYRYVRTDSGLALVANYNRGGDLPYDTIRLYPVPSADEGAAAFATGQVSAAFTDFSSPYSLGYSGSYEVWDYATPDLLYVGFRTSGGFCADPLVRRAFSNAFDRDTVVKLLLSGRGAATALPISPFQGEWDSEADALLNYNAENAAALLAQAGCKLNEEDGLLYRGRTVLAVTLLVNSDNPAKAAIADLLAEELGELGVSVTVSKLPWKDYLNALSRGQFDLYLGEVRLTGDFDPSTLLFGSLNYGGYGSADLSAALSGWKGASGQGRVEAAKALWEVFAREAPIAALCFKEESMLVRWDTVSGLDPIWGDPFRDMENWIPAME